MLFECCKGRLIRNCSGSNETLAPVIALNQRPHIAILPGDLPQQELAEVYCRVLGLRRARIRERILHVLVLTSVKTFDYSVSPPGMDFPAAAQRVNEA